MSISSIFIDNPENEVYFMARIDATLNAGGRPSFMRSRRTVAEAAAYMTTSGGKIP